MNMSLINLSIFSGIAYNINTKWIAKRLPANGHFVGALIHVDTNGTYPLLKRDEERTIMMATSIFTKDFGIDLGRPIHWFIQKEKELSCVNPP